MGEIENIFMTIRDRGNMKKNLHLYIPKKPQNIKPETWPDIFANTQTRNLTQTRHITTFFGFLAHYEKNTESKKRRLFNVWFEYPLGTFERDGTVNIYNLGNFKIDIICVIFF